MSKITEYANLIIKGAPHIKQIMEAVVANIELKYGNLPEEERVEIVRRRLICEQCPFMSKNAVASVEYKELTGRHYKAARKAAHCGFCGCNLEMRTSSLDSDCGIVTWNKDNPDKQIPLKWTKFNKNGSDKKN